MNNHVMLIGKIYNDVEKIEVNDQVTYQLMLNISSNFKNQNGVYEISSDLLEKIHDLTNYVGSKVFQYCKKNDLIGIRGRLESKEGNLIKVVAEKVTFLSSNRELLNQK